ncbi:unnamed protein product [Linum tenue]|uniref:Uncharacterized protein n=1 Tax=Linum tenue TaxID=586396 RepID=A0AAV0QR11_9ROSI|nr:unnamed protein product [Linum tenue]
MEKTKSPNRGASKSKNPVNYICRQVQVEDIWASESVLQYLLLQNPSRARSPCRT